MNCKAVPLLVASLALAVLAPVAGGAEPRRATMEYAPTDENVSVGLPGEGPGPQVANRKYTFPLRKGERYVSVAIEDDSETMVASAIAQWRRTARHDGGNASAETFRLVMIHHFCGYTEEPVRVNPKYDFDVWIKDGTCEDGTPSTPTSGRIVADVYGG